VTYACGYGSIAPASGRALFHSGIIALISSIFEHYREVRDAIAREKQLKGWLRAKKNTLIATLNPQWDDLAADWFENFVEPNTCHPERSATESKDL
jgi:hypothetical protein